VILGSPVMAVRNRSFARFDRLGADHPCWGPARDRLPGRSILRDHAGTDFTNPNPEPDPDSSNPLRPIVKSLHGTFPSGTIFVGGSKTLSTAASAVDTVDIQCTSTGVYLCNLNKAYA